MWASGAGLGGREKWEPHDRFVNKKSGTDAGV